MSQTNNLPSSTTAPIETSTIPRRLSVLEQTATKRGISFKLFAVSEEIKTTLDSDSEKIIATDSLQRKVFNQ